MGRDTAPDGAAGVSRKRTNPCSGDDGTSPPPKRRVLTTARREQNRLAQKAYRQRQKEDRQRLKEAKAQVTHKQRLRPLLKRDDPPSCEGSDHGDSRQEELDTQEQSIQDLSQLVIAANSPTQDIGNPDTDEDSEEFPDVYLNMLQFAPVSLFSSLLANAVSLGFDLSRLGGCSAEYVSPFYQPNLSGALNPTCLTQAGSAIISSFNNTNVPMQLRPTMAQILIPHHASLDLIPLPFLRERAIMLSAAMPHIFNIWELKVDIYEKGGLTLWRHNSAKQGRKNSRNSYPPWEMKSWEAAPWFLKKWCMVSDEENEELHKQSIGWQVLNNSKHIQAKMAAIRTMFSNLKKRRKVIYFEDGIGRTFKFPFAIAKKWEGVEHLIKQAFVRVDTLRPHVMEGYYDLYDSDGDIMLPGAWDLIVKPGMRIRMVVSPMDLDPQQPPEPSIQQELPEEAEIPQQNAPGQESRVDQPPTELIVEGTDESEWVEDIWG
ncbi:hypothetical protein FSARC_13535 [Fusarium sarcochroum]|uniref:BZIP domain-containing protein n=1 Tax=Fusarium sarcochroum TaxID=1208366 RepID=A0A8H4T100_9HYPO|nr:hypothetical protein FSARC_13535 [Fusarium sarcochroum]